MEKVINAYETLFIADVTAGEEAAKATVKKFTDIIAGNATIVDVADWGKRRLAYLINDKPEGYYTVVTFKAEPSFPTELERLFNIDETVMRSLVIKLDYEPVAKPAPAPEETTEEAEEPVAEEVKAEEPAAEEVKAEEVKAEEPVAEEPVAEAPKPKKPATRKPKAEKPAAEEVKAEEPKAEEPEAEKTAETPAAEEPAAE